jgi:mannose/fructose-specific phosphotransferase system component IIA
MSDSSPPFVPPSSGATPAPPPADPDTALGIVVSHGAMSQGLIDAVQRITGFGSEALIPVTNDAKGPDALTAAVNDAACGWPGPVVIFTDLEAGSCALAARFACRDPQARTVVFGVNLPMLLDFVFHRTLPLFDLEARLVERGRAGIRSLERQGIHGNRPVSGG